MFAISHSAEDTFRLEIHGSPSELDPASARQLHCVLLGLARVLDRELEGAAPGGRGGVVREEQGDGAHGRPRMAG